MSETISERVLSLGWTLPPPSSPVANFLPTLRVGNLLYIAGQIPVEADRYLGRLGAELDLNLGRSAARSAALALLAHISSVTRVNISMVRQVVRLGVFIAAVSDFKQHPEVANGASDLFVRVEIRHVSVHDLGTQKSGLVSFTVAGIGALDVRAKLAAEQISVGANGIAYTPLDMRARGLNEIVRASVSYFNTEDEIARIIAAVATIARSAS